MSNKLPKLKHIQLNIPKIELDLLGENPSARFQTALMAKVADHQDKVLCDAIIKYATDQGYTDLYLIDEEFIRSAIIHEIERRTRNASVQHL